MTALSRRLPFLPGAGLWLLVIGGSLFAGVGLAGGDTRAAMLTPLLGAAAAFVIALSLPVEWVFLGWLFFAPFLQDSLFGAPIVSPLQLALYQAPPLVLLLWTLHRRGDGKRGRWYDVLPAVSLAYIAIAIGLSGWIGHDASTYRSLYYTVGIGIVMYYVSAFGPGRLDPERVVRVIFASGIVVALFALVQAASGWSPWADNGWALEHRVVGPLQNPAVLGTFLSAVVVLSSACFVWPVDRTTRRFAAIAILPAFLAVALTYTRAAILAALVFGLLIGLTKLRARLVTIGIVACAALIVAGNWGKISTTAAYQERFSNRTNVEARVLIQDWSLQLAEQRPLFGWGYSSFDEVKNAANLSPGRLPIEFGRESTSHNTFLTILVELGLAGLTLAVLPLTLIYFQIARYAKRTTRYRWFLVGIVGVFGVYLLNATAIDMRFFSFVPAFIWMFAGLGRRVMLAEES